jgi:ankyrin repeat protein
MDRTALFVAAANGSVEVVNYMLEAGVDFLDSV